MSRDWQDHYDISDIISRCIERHNRGLPAVAQVNPPHGDVRQYILNDQGHQTVFDPASVLRRARDVIRDAYRSGENLRKVAWSESDHGVPLYEKVRTPERVRDESLMRVIDEWGSGLHDTCLMVACGWSLANGVSTPYAGSELKAANAVDSSFFYDSGLDMAMSGGSYLPDDNALDALRKCSSDIDRRVSLVKRGREYIREKRDLERNCPRVQGHYAPPDVDSFLNVLWADAAYWAQSATATVPGDVREYSAIGCIANDVADLVTDYMGGEVLQGVAVLCGYTYDRTSTRRAQQALMIWWKQTLAADPNDTYSGLNAMAWLWQFVNGRHRAFDYATAPGFECDWQPTVGSAWLRELCDAHGAVRANAVLGVDTRGCSWCVARRAVSPYLHRACETLAEHGFADAAHALARYFAHLPYQAAHDETARGVVLEALHGLRQPVVAILFALTRALPRRDMADVLENIALHVWDGTCLGRRLMMNQLRAERRTIELDHAMP